MSTSSRQLARAMALAMLDGAWREDAMCARVSAAVEVPAGLVEPLVRAVLQAHERAPHEAHATLIELVWRLVAERDFGDPEDAAGLTTDAEPAADAPVISTVLFAKGWPLFRVRRTPSPTPRAAPPPRALRRSGIPPLGTHADLAALLHIDMPELVWLARPAAIDAACPPARRHYERRWVPKRSGGARLLEAPRIRLRRAQRALLDGHLSAVPAHPAAHGFVRGRDARTFAAPHIGRALVVRLDLEDFFASVSAPRVRAILRTLGLAEGVLESVLSLCTTRAPEDVLRALPARDPEEAFRARARLRTRHLPQGAPTSPSLANLAALALDRRIDALARAVDASYTRYADDLALSTDAPRRLLAVLPQLGAIAIEEGFTVRFRKTRVMRASVRQEICGLVVNLRAQPRRERYDALRARLHGLALRGVPQASDPHALCAELEGHIAWVAAGSETRTRKLRALMSAIAWD